jgi:hypothetical protein
VIEIGFEGCTTTFTVTFSAVVDFFLCANPGATASASGCPSADTVLIESKRIPGLKKDVTRYFSKLELIQQTLTYKLIKAVLVQDFVDCWHGSASGCAWAASNFIPGKAFTKVFDGIRALDVAMKTGVGVRDAFKALKILDLDPGTLAQIERSVKAYEDVVTACRANSFPGSTQVLMADGSQRAIRDVRIGDLVLATDPESGITGPRRVDATIYTPDDREFTDITLDPHNGGGSLSATDHHPFWSEKDKKWKNATDLTPQDTLRTPEGDSARISGIRHWTGLAPAYNLTVDDLHTYYVMAGRTPVLVHNTSCPVTFADLGGGNFMSPGGLIYGADRKYGHKINHVLAHTVPDPSRATHTVFLENNPNKVLDLVDQAWAMQSKAIRDPNDAFRFVFYMGEEIGTRGEKYLQIAVDPQTKFILSAYPVASP